MKPFLVLELAFIEQARQAALGEECGSRPALGLRGALSGPFLSVILELGDLCPDKMACRMLVPTAVLF